MRVRRKLPILVRTGTAEREVRRGRRDIRRRGDKGERDDVSTRILRKAWIHRGTPIKAVSIQTISDDGLEGKKSSHFRLADLPCMPPTCKGPRLPKRALRRLCLYHPYRIQ